MKILLTGLLLLFTLLAYSQIEINQQEKRYTVGKVKQGSRFLAELTYSIEENDTTYFLMYNNAEYERITDIQSVDFSSDDNTVGKLYDILKTFFSDENKKNKEYAVNLSLGSSQVTLKNFRVMGITSIMFFTSRGHFFLSEKNVDKLFGK